MQPVPLVQYQIYFKSYNKVDHIRFRLTLIDVPNKKIHLNLSWTLYASIFNEFNGIQE